jgi:hypothetical protein
MVLVKGGYGKRVLAAVALLCAMLPHTGAQAGFVHTDWLATGDSRAVLHQETGIEWMRFSTNNTLGKSFDQVVGLLGTTYAGWRLPTEAEVSTMMSGLYGGLAINFSFTDAYYGPYLEGARAFARAFGLNDMDDNKFGAYRTAGGAVRVVGYNVNTGGSYAATYGTGFLHDYGPTATYGFRGALLVNDGGVTLSSTLDPSINSNNPLAPVSNTAPVDGGGDTAPVDGGGDTAIPVSASGALLGSVGLIMMGGSGLSARRRKLI